MIQFRRNFIIPELRFNEEEGSVTEFVLRDGKVTIKFTALPIEQGQSISPGSRAEVILTVRNPKPELVAVLEATKINRLPQSGEELITAMIEAKQGAPWENQTIFLMEAMPDPFRGYSRSATDRMSAALERFVGLLRWRYAQWGPPRAIVSSQPAQWSDDGGSWYYLPFEPQSTLTGDVTLGFDEARRDEMVALFDGTTLEEPLYRELMREANHIQKTSNRAALILAVASAEIAIKVAILELAPALYEVDLRTEGGPPATQMYADLAEYLATRSGDEIFVKPSERLIEALQKAVAARNTLVHAGAAPLSRDSLIEKINALRDLILLVDHYKGFAWAFPQLTEPTKAELTTAAGTSAAEGKPG